MLLEREEGRLLLLQLFLELLSLSLLLQLLPLALLGSGRRWRRRRWRRLTSSSMGLQLARQPPANPAVPFGTTGSILPENADF
jgi:hypothetical protein